MPLNEKKLNFLAEQGDRILRQQTINQNELRGLMAGMSSQLHSINGALQAQIAAAVPAKPKCKSAWYEVWKCDKWKAPAKL